MVKPMRAALLALSALSVLAFPAHAVPVGASLLDDEPSARSYALGKTLDGGLQEAVRPAYRVVEGLTDGVYEFMRSHLIGGILPGRLTRNLKAAPRKDSAELFSRNLRARQARFLDRARETYPRMSRQGGVPDQKVLQVWRQNVLEEQQGVALDAVVDTLMQRYQLEPFGRASQEFAKDSRNWDAGSAAMASVMGGALVFVSGLHVSVPAGNLSLDVDMRPGRQIARALSSGASVSGLGTFELGYKKSPVTLAMEWGAAGGRVRADSAGLKYRLRY